MSDLISREGLLKQIEIDSNGEPGYYGDTWKFIDTIKNMPSAQPDLEEAYICGETEAEARYHAQQRWIPCSERLPDKPNVYMVTDHDGRVVRYVYNDNESSREYWKRCAKAWMPLPEPYHGGKNENR